MDKRFTPIFFNVFRFSRAASPGFISKVISVAWDKSKFMLRALKIFSIYFGFIILGVPPPI